MRSSSKTKKTRVVAEPHFRRLSVAVFALVFALVGVYLILRALAAGNAVMINVTEGMLSGPATIVAESAAIGGHALMFGSAAGQSSAPTGTASTAKPTSTPSGGGSGGSTPKPGSTPTPAPGLPPGTIFADSFPGTALSSAWQVISRHGEYAQSETECNTPDMVGVANNTLTINTIAKNVTCGDFNLDGSVRHAASSWPYDTGDIQWKTLSFTYGTVSVRAKFPPKSTHTWPAIWMLGSNCQATNSKTADVGYSTCPNIETTNYAEIDNTECFSSTWCQLSMSQPGSWAACSYHTPVDANWHTYKMVWTKTSVTAYIDGNSTGCSFTSAAGYKIPSTPMFLIIQTQTGGVGGTPSNLPTSFQVSNVTVTQP